MFVSSHTKIYDNFANKFQKNMAKKASQASNKSQPSPKISNNELISIFSRDKMF